jgi:hypothetical protein
MSIAASDQVLWVMTRKRTIATYSRTLAAQARPVPTALWRAIRLQAPGLRRSCSRLRVLVPPRGIAVSERKAATESWSDKPAQRWNDRASERLTASVFPTKGMPSEIVLEGSCPRCGHPMTSTHPVRALITPERAGYLAQSDGVELPTGSSVRRVSAECACRHDHPGRPEGASGCGAPFALWVLWTRPDEDSDWQAESAPAKGFSGVELEDERELMAVAETALTNIRKAAESWRTGLAGFLVLLLAVFFIRGKDRFEDIDGEGWRYLLAALLLGAAIAALYGSYRALRAAYGTPRDEYLGEVKGVLQRLPRQHWTTPRLIDQYGTLSAWRHAWARTAVADLRRAKVATIVSVVLVGGAAVVTWFAPGPPPPALARVSYMVTGVPKELCGSLVSSAGGSIQVRDQDGRSATVPLGDVVSLQIVTSC